MRKINRDLGILTYNGKSSIDFGIIVEKLPSLSRPERQHDVFKVPGRNGDIIQQYDAYDNITITYEVWFANNNIDSMNAQQVARQIAAWLYNTNGYCRLEDDFEPDIFRLAYYVGDLNIVNELTAYGKAKISFNCRPERYFKTGEDWFTNPAVINNEQYFEAKPLIKVEGHGNVNFSIQGQTITLTGLVDYVYLDCETQDCYRELAENRNNLMTGNFPVLKLGTNNIAKSSGITNLKIQPRFWTL